MLPIQYSCDVWVSYRGRQLGYETRLVHGYDLVHHQEQVGRGAGMAQHERDAMDTATMREELAKAAEEAALDTPTGAQMRKATQQRVVSALRHGK
jgi:hypothetical protein